MPGWVWRPAQLPGATSAIAVTVVKPGGKSVVCSGVRLIVDCAAADATTSIAARAAMADVFLGIWNPPWAAWAGSAEVRGGGRVVCCGGYAQQVPRRERR